MKIVKFLVSLSLILTLNREIYAANPICPNLVAAQAQPRSIDELKAVLKREKLEFGSFHDNSVALFRYLIDGSKLDRLLDVFYNHGNKYRFIGLFSQQERFMLAKSDATWYGKFTIQYIHYYGLDENQRFEVAKIVADKFSDEPKYYLRQDSLTIRHRLEVEKIHTRANHRRRLARLIALGDIGGVCRTIQNYDLSESHRFELAKISAGKDGWVTSEYIRNFALSKESDRFEVAKIAVIKDFGAEINFDKYALNPEQLEKVRSVQFKYALVRNSRTAVTKRIESALEKGRKLFLLQAVPDLKLALARVPEKLVPKALVDLAWDKVQKRETGLRIIEEGFKRIENKRGKLAGTSLEFVCELTGLEYDKLIGLNPSESTLGSLYEITLDLQKNVEFGVFHKIKLDQSFFKEKRLLQELDFFLALRDLKSVLGDDVKAYHQVLSILKSELRLMGRIGQTEDVLVTKQNVQALKARVEQEIKARVEQEIKARVEQETVDTVQKLMNGEKIKFTLDDFRRLQQAMPIA